MADESQLFGLTPKQDEMLGKMLRWWETYRQETAPLPLKYRPSKLTMVGYATSEIAAASGDITSGGGLTPGIGTVQPCRFTGTIWKATADDPVSAHNLSGGTISAHVPLQLKRINGFWCIDFQDC